MDLSTKAYVDDLHAGACKATPSTMQALANNQGYKEMYKCMNSSCSCQLHAW